VGVQRASRVIGRRFDEAFRAVGLNNWQFSLLMTLNRPAPMTVGELADELAMDRTTTTANLKPLERRGFLEIRQDDEDGRVRRLFLTEAGKNVLSEAIRAWSAANAAVTASLSDNELRVLRAGLLKIAEH
jgi:DNA-binding MarR family transcriptional regulator